MVIKLSLDEDIDGLTFVHKSKKARVDPSSSSDIAVSPKAKVQPIAALSSTLPEWRIRKEADKRDNEKLVNTATKKNTKWTEKNRSVMSERDWRIMRADLEVQFRVVGSKSSRERLEPLLHWSELNSSKLIQYLIKNFPKPTPVQRCAIELVLENQNAVIKAPTGSGKTLGFLVPFFEKMPTRALVLAPTRELAVQIGQEAQKICQFVNANLEIAVLVGGLDMDKQVKQLLRQPRLIVATPGRLLDFLTGGEAVIISDCDYLVFDEADRMVDLGFEPQITAIMQHMHSQRRQMLMFSATWPPSVENMGRPYLGPDYVVVQIGREAEQISQTAELVADDAEKLKKVRPLLQKHRPSIVFVRTKEAAQQLSQQLNDTVRCAPLHGNLGQEARNAAVSNLKSQKISCLVATDVVSRGVDIPGVALVINYDLPNDIETYIHRIGRTGRAGSKGRAISFVTAKDAKILPDLRRVLRQAGSTPTF